MRERQRPLWNRRIADARFSHSICPDCMRHLYPELLDDDESLGTGEIPEKNR